METATFFQWVKGAESYQLHTRVTLKCGHDFTYSGVPEDAERKMLEIGAVKARNGDTRCKSCNDELAAIIYDALRTM